MARLAPSLILSRFLIALAAVTASVAAQGHGIPGSLPGTERWLVCLDRGYDLEAQLRQIRSQATAAQRTMLVNALEQLAQTDQAQIAQIVGSLGGRIERHYWISSIAAVDVPPTLLPALRAQPRVRALVPVQARGLCDGGPNELIGREGRVAAPPIGTSTDALNHRVAEAQAILRNAQVQPSLADKGAGAVAAFFDTGIDKDSNGFDGATVTPHPSFVDAGGATRVLAHLGASGTTQAIDCNMLTLNAPFWGPTGPFAFRSLYHSFNAGHGTAMAGIAAGNADLAAGRGISAGHAPEADIFDVSISEVPGGMTAADPWISTDVSYLGGIQSLQKHILLTGNRVHVLDISFYGYPDPMHPVSVALDHLAREEDILLVTSAGNNGDETWGSNGFYHGLAVGSVHARIDTSPTQPTNLSFTPMAMSARGPLSSNMERWYPDVCSTGAGPGGTDWANPGPQIVHVIAYGGTYAPVVQASQLLMPALDVDDPYYPGNRRYAMGTSEASAQVSGAATLYRAARVGGTAEEARAAILLNVSGTYCQRDGTGPTRLADQDGYRNRNSYGVGYVRDDLLAQFAAGLAGDAQQSTLVQPLAQVVTFTKPETKSLQYGAAQALVAGDLYGIAICWRRLTGPANDPELDLPNVDLEVWNAAHTSRLARSASIANSYERVAFRATSTSVAVDVILRDLPPNGQTLAVQVVARRLRQDSQLNPPPPDIDPTTSDPRDQLHAMTGHVESIPAGTACVGSARELVPFAIVPSSYAGAYGSAEFQLQWRWAYWPQNGGYYVHAPRRFNLGMAEMQQPRRLHVQICASEMPSNTVQIGGIAFRSWRPFTMDGDLPVQGVWAESIASTTTVTTTSLATPPTSPAVAAPMNLAAAGSGSSARGFESWPIVLPFSSSVTCVGGQDLHIWIDLVPGPDPIPLFEVDSVDDNVGGSGYAFGTWTGAGAWEGACPMIALLPATGMSSQQPRLSVLGEPWIGETMDVQLTNAPAGRFGCLVFGAWSPGTGSPCAQHLDLLQPYTSILLVPDLNGFARCSLPIVNDPALINSGIGMQQAMLPPVPAPPGMSLLLSNGVRIIIGGAL